MAAITNFLRRMFVSGKTIRINSFDANEDTYSVSHDISLHEYGIFTVVDYIATLMQQAQWHTYRNNKKFKGAEWFAWNIRPNVNQSAADFWHELIARMLLWGEVLVFESNGERFIADNPISIDEGDGVQPWKFCNVGRLTYRKSHSLLPSEVLYFKYDNSCTRAAIAGLCDMYSKLTISASESYQESGGNKGTLHIDTHQTGTDDQQAAQMKTLQERFKVFCKAKNAILPLNKGFSYTHLPSTSTNGREVSDITSLRADALKMACEAYHMPYGLISGEIAGTSDAWELGTATVLNPLRQIFETEINGKLYTVADIINGTSCKCDISHIKPINIFEKAEHIDKLISSGFYTVNEAHEAADIDKVNDKTADKRYITKNYSEMEEIGGADNADE